MANSYDQEQRRLSQESLQIALFSLMKVQPFASITVSELCKKAGISRMAFYRNYNSKEEVIVDYFKNYVQPFYQYLSGQPQKNPVVITRAFFEYVDQHTELFEVLIKSGAESLLIREFTNFVSQFYLENVRSIPFEGEYAFYWNSFISAGLYNMTIEWIKNDKKTSIDLLTKLTVQIGG